MVKKKFPSQKKYEEENPAITFRIKKHEKELILGMVEKSGKSVSDIVRMSLLDKEKDFSEAYDKASCEGYDRGIIVGKNQGYKDGYTEGYNKSKVEFGLKITCKKCDKTFYIATDYDFRAGIIEYMDRIGWSHEGCSGKSSGNTVCTATPQATNNNCGRM